ncbi:MAG: hypothetical protein ABTD50_15185 [Polyangiaceae bacterium]
MSAIGKGRSDVAEGGAIGGGTASGASLSAEAPVATTGWDEPSAASADVLLGIPDVPWRVPSTLGAAASIGVTIPAREFEIAGRPPDDPHETTAGSSPGLSPNGARDSIRESLAFADEDTPWLTTPIELGTERSDPVLGERVAADLARGARSTRGRWSDSLTAVACA